MRKCIVLVALVGVTAYGPGKSLTAQGPQSVRRTVIQAWDSVDTPDATLAERVQKADAIVVARVVRTPRTRAAQVQGVLERLNPGVVLPPVVYPLTEYQVRVGEAMLGRAGVVAGASLTIGRVGGRVSWGDHDVLLERRMPTLQPDGTYLLFLRYDALFEMMMFANEDIFRVDQDTVTVDRAAHQAGFVFELVDKSPASVLARIRETLAATSPVQ
jgi:hypothetical protein